jgi:hypothetical protein
LPGGRRQVTVAGFGEQLDRLRDVGVRTDGIADAVADRFNVRVDAEPNGHGEVTADRRHQSDRR